MSNTINTKSYTFTPLYLSSFQDLNDYRSIFLNDNHTNKNNTLSASIGSTITSISEKLNADMIEIKFIEKVLASINFSFIILGTIGNLITFLILMRKNVRKHSCMRYLAALSILDLFCLYTWNFSFVYSIVRNKKIEHEGAIICRFFSFFCYFVLQSSSWIICSIGMDRIITMVMKTATNRITKIAKNTRIVTAFVIGTCFAFNFVVIINNAEPFNQSESLNKTNGHFWRKSLSNSSTNSNNINLNASANSKKQRTYTCYEPRKFYAFWDIFHIIMYSLLPFFIILIENLILSYLTIRHSKKMKRHNLNLSYPMNKLEQMPITPEFKEKFTLREKIEQKFDKKKRVYRKAVNIHTNDSTGSKLFNKCQTSPVNTTTDANGESEVTSNFNSANFTRHITTQQAKRNKKLQTKTSHVANLLLFLTVSFLFTTVPYSTYYALGLNINFDYKSKKIVVGVLTAMQYTRHSANFLIYLFTSSIIKSEMKVIIDEIKKYFRQKISRLNFNS